MRTMFVYRPNGHFYFRTQIMPWLETQEEDYWTGQGYRVEWDEALPRKNAPMKGEHDDVD